MLVGVDSVYLDLTSVRFARRASIEDLAVRERWRSSGIGARLLFSFQAGAADQRADYVFLESDLARTLAPRFYLQQGAIQVASPSDGPGTKVTAGLERCGADRRRTRARRLAVGPSRDRAISLETTIRSGRQVRPHGCVGGAYALRGKDFRADVELLERPFGVSRILKCHF